MKPRGRVAVITGGAGGIGEAVAAELIARGAEVALIDIDGLYRTKLFHAIKDLTADSYGGWKLVTNMQSGGGLYAQRIVTRGRYDMENARAQALAAARLDAADSR